MQGIASGLGLLSFFFVLWQRTAVDVSADLSKRRR